MLLDKLNIFYYHHDYFFCATNIFKYLDSDKKQYVVAMSVRHQKEQKNSVTQLFNFSSVFAVFFLTIHMSRLTIFLLKRSVSFMHSSVE